MTAPRAAADPYQAAAEAWAAAADVDPRWSIQSNHAGLRAAVDAVVRLTEQRVAPLVDPEPILRRAEEATRKRDAEVESRVRAEAKAEVDHWQQLERRAWDLIKAKDADLAAMTARIAELETELITPLNASELATLVRAKAGVPLDPALIRRMVLGYLVRIAELKQRTAIVDITTLGDHSRRQLCNNCGHITETPRRPVDGWDEAAPETGPTPTLPAEQPGAQGPDAGTGRDALSGPGGES
jgi:hypothetical protein